MSGITGIELGPNRCVIVRTGRGGSRPTVSAARTVTPEEWSTDLDALATLLRDVRRAHEFPARARVVAWGIGDWPPADFSQVPAFAPLIAAGFEIHRALSPAQALARIVRARKSDVQASAVAALSLNTEGATIAIVSGGQVVSSRSFEWVLGKPFSGSRPEELERYLVIAQLAPQLQHVIELARPVHGIRVSSVIACGNLPSLRSLSMLLIDELDIEVETLDAPELLEPQCSNLADSVAALQLASAAASAVDEVVAAQAVDHREKAPHHPAPAPRPAMRAELHDAAIPARHTPLLHHALGFAALALCAGWTFLQISGATPAVPIFASAPTDLAVTGRRSPAVPDFRPEATMGRMETERPPRVTSPSREATPRPETSAPAPEQPAPAHEPPAPEQPAPAPEPPAPEPGAPELPARTAPRAAAPAAPRIDPPSLPPLPTVDGIMISGDRRLAIVGGEVVVPGDPVGPRIVARIDRNGVVLREPSGREVYVAIRTRKPPGGGL
jgi:hypothetical protein